MVSRPTTWRSWWTITWWTSLRWCAARSGISSTPKHLLLYSWLGWDAPQFAHMPLLRNTDKSKISKRKNPAARLMWFREQGYLPEALRNFLQPLAYPPAAGEQEVSSFEEFRC